MYGRRGAALVGGAVGGGVRRPGPGAARRRSPCPLVRPVPRDRRGDRRRRPGTAGFSLTRHLPTVSLHPFAHGRQAESTRPVGNRAGAGPRERRGNHAPCNPGRGGRGRHRRGRVRPGAGVQADRHQRPGRPADRRRHQHLLPHRPLPQPGRRRDHRRQRLRQDAQQPGRRQAAAEADHPARPQPAAAAGHVPVHRVQELVRPGDADVPDVRQDAGQQVTY